MSRIYTLILLPLLLTCTSIGCSQPDPITAEYEPADCNCVETSTTSAEAPPAETTGLADEADELQAEAVPAVADDEEFAPAEEGADDAPEPAALAEPAKFEPAAAKKAPAASDKETADAPKGVVNLNTATLSQLMALPGVGPALAGRIVEFRKERRFDKPAHLLRVKGIGKSKFAKLAPMLAVEGPTTLKK